jgi:methionyl aminopeptidase
MVISSFDFEKVRSDFNLEQLLLVQRETFSALHTLASQIHVGMLEEDAYQLAKKVLKELGFEKNWHRPYVRFGQNTALMYGRTSVPGVRLKENDLFFLDIGTVKGGYEGDAGETFLIGEHSEYQKCISDSKLLFHEVENYWRMNKLTGIQLYEYAFELAKKMGWLLNPEWRGRRISDFPHQIYFKGHLSEVEQVPSSGLWVLEIHLCDPQMRFGAFYEDILIFDAH